MPRKPKYPKLEEVVKKLTHEALLEEAARNDGTRLWWLACERLRHEFPAREAEENFCRPSRDDKKLGGLQ